MSIAVKSEPLLKSETELRKLAKKLGSIESSLEAIRNRLDWDVRKERNIDGTFKNVIQDVAQGERELTQLAKFLADTIKAYEEAERKIKGDLNNIAGKPRIQIYRVPRTEDILEKMGIFGTLLKIIFGLERLKKIFEELGIIMKFPEIPKPKEPDIPILSGNLSYDPNNYNPDVLLLQKRLNELGITDENGNRLEEDGLFGKHTLAAVNKFKDQNGILNTGIYFGVVGKDTWKYLFTTNPTQTPKPVPLPKPPENPNPAEDLIQNPNGNVSNTNAAVPVTPLITNTGARSAENYSSVIDQFNVATNPRYAKRNGNTYCNIFMWDVTLAMGAEIPHWVNRQTNEPYTYNPNLSYSENAQVAREMNANAVADWLRDYGPSHGWRLVSAEEAQNAANQGKPTVGAWHNPNGIGHVVVVRPSTANDGKVHIAQAGASNYNDGVVDTNSNFGKGVLYYTHD